MHFRVVGVPEKRLTVVRDLGETCIMFLVHPALTQQITEATCRAVRKVMLRAGQVEEFTSLDKSAT
jgi:hypothetical protein